LSYSSARLWLVKASLIIIGANFVFLIAAPALGYPLTFDRALVVAEMIVPLFVGYLGAAAAYAFSAGERTSPKIKDANLVKLMVQGPVFLAAVLSVVLYAVFGWTNWPRPGLITGYGMPYEVLTACIALILSIYTATTGAAFGYLFATEKKEA
jgi:hypothetical protein